MKYRKFSKLEKKQVRAEVLEQATHGEGLYLYENHHAHDLRLPRPTKSGLRVVNARQQFQGDNYYMQLVRSGELRFIKEIQSPVQEQMIMENEQKLILDQPDRVTADGQTEHVVKGMPKQKLNESDNEPAPDVLLNEGPVGDGFVIMTG